MTPPRPVRFSRPRFSRHHMCRVIRGMSEVVLGLGWGPPTLRAMKMPPSLPRRNGCRDREGKVSWHQINADRRLRGRGGLLRVAPSRDGVKTDPLDMVHQLIEGPPDREVALWTVPRMGRGGLRRSVRFSVEAFVPGATRFTRLVSRIDGALSGAVVAAHNAENTGREHNGADAPISGDARNGCHRRDRGLCRAVRG
jgi:hypothetical protein